MTEMVFTGERGFRAPVTSIRLYSDGTPMIKMENFDDIVDRADTLVLRPKGMQGFVEAMFLIDAITVNGGWIKNLILPYIPGARQDRSNPTGDVLFTLRSVAVMLNARSFKRVLVLDPHSPVSMSYITNAEAYPLELLADKMWHGYTGIISADKGGKDRAEQFAKAMNKPIFYGAKRRDVSTGKLSGFEVEELPKGGHFLVVDDICDGGGTFVGLAAEIEKQGCFADLFVTHGIFSKGSSELRKAYGNVYTTDSRDIHDRHVHIIEVVNDMEEYL